MRTPSQPMVYSSRLFTALCLVRTAAGSPDSRSLRGATNGSNTTLTQSSSSSAAGNATGASREIVHESTPRTLSSGWSPWHMGVCPNKKSWSDLKLECDGCTALVNHRRYGSTCDAYCKSQGLQCLNGWEEMNDDCEAKSRARCSEPILGTLEGYRTSDALCECIVPCSQTGESCADSACCQNSADNCFETTFGAAMCKRSCTPGVDSTCRLPFDHPRAQAPRSWRWPDIVCILGSAEVLVKPEVFRSKYGSDCSRYCVEGAGKAVSADDVYAYWISVNEATEATEHVCPDADDSKRGVKCHCSFPDRL